MSQEWAVSAILTSSRILKMEIAGNVLLKANTQTVVCLKKTL